MLIYSLIRGVDVDFLRLFHSALWSRLTFPELLIVRYRFLNHCLKMYHTTWKDKLSFQNKCRKSVTKTFPIKWFIFSIYLPVKWTSLTPNGSEIGNKLCPRIGKKRTRNSNRFTDYVFLFEKLLSLFRKHISAVQNKS